MLTGYLCGDLTIYLSEDKDVIEESKEFAALSMAQNSTMIRHFMAEIIHMAKEHGLEETRHSLARWKQKIAVIDEAADEIIRAGEK